MKETIKNMLFFIAIIIIVPFIFRDDSSKELDALSLKYNSMVIQNDSLKSINNSLELDKNSLYFLSADQSKVIDSLDNLIFRDRFEPCEHKLKLEKELSKNLRKQLALCEETNSIQAHQIRNYKMLETNTRVVLDESMQIIEKAESKDKRRKVLRWIERAGWVTLIALILI